MMKVLLWDGDSRYIVQTDTAEDVPPGMQSVVVVDGDRVSPVRRLGSVLAQMDPDDLTEWTGVPPADVMSAARRSLR